MPPGTEGDCRSWTYDCRHDNLTVVLISLESAVFLAYFALFFFYLCRAFHQLRARNYRRVPSSLNLNLSVEGWLFYFHLCRTFHQLRARSV